MNTPPPPAIYRPEETIHPQAGSYFAKQEASTEGRIRLRLHVLLQDAPTTALRHTGALDTVMEAVTIELEDAERNAQRHLRDREQKCWSWGLVQGLIFGLVAFTAFLLLIEHFTT